MSDEKANNQFHWKDRLDGLDHLPGEAPVDKEAGWQQLHDRLQKRSHHRRKSGYWIAAACLLGVMILTKLLLMQPESSLVKKDAHPTPHLSHPLPATGNQATVAFVEQTAKKNARLPGSGNTFHRALVKGATTSGPVPLPDTTKEGLPAAAIYQPVDTVRLVAAAPKKKLRVVHINELDRPGDDVQLASNIPELSSATPVRENDSHFSISRNASDNIVKIKLSSSN